MTNHCMTLAAPVRGRRTERNALGLTPRQSEVLRLIAEAKCEKRIARELGSSIGTTKVHTTQVFRALGVTSRAEAIVEIARRSGFDLVAAVDTLANSRP